MLGLNDRISKTIEGNNSNFAIRIEHIYRLTKNKNEATDTIAVDKNSPNPVQIIKEVKDPNETHKFNTKKTCAEITKRIQKQRVPLKYNGNLIGKFNLFHFNLFCKYYGIKDNQVWCYVHRQFTQPNYTYSMQAVEFITEEIKKDPENILDNIRASLKKKED